jgi:dimethylargininase
MFSNAIVRVPCRGIKDGLATTSLGKPDYAKALEQHLKYIEALELLGLKVKILDKNDKYPDSTFIEDVALCTPVCAVITNPGAESRRGEIEGMKEVLEGFYNIIEEIISPGTLEAGDVMKAGDNYYIGISERTNIEGAEQLMRILAKYGMRGTSINLTNLLHLKSGVSFLENNNLLVSGELFHEREFNKYNRISVDDDELYAVNSLWINGIVLLPEGYPKTREKIEKAGYETIELDVSEFRKVDGGLSCLSLRF